MQRTAKAGIAAIILCLGFIKTNCSLAGTSQIFSPAGLPRSSSQDYSIPDTTVPTQTFPTPPIPMGDVGLQGFSSVPLKEELTTNGAKPATQTTKGPNNSIVPAASGSVESFFQCAPVPVVKEEPLANANKSVGFSLGKVIWHTLDNIGVPLPTSKTGELDPSLSKTYVIQPQRQSSETNIQPIHQKIPDSELGVTDIPIKDDAKLH